MARKTNMPPTPLGRFIAAMRGHACAMAATRDIPPYVRDLINELPLLGHPKVLRRQDVETLAAAIYQEERRSRPERDVPFKRSKDDPRDYHPVTEVDISNLEHGRSRLGREKLYWALRGVLLSDSEADFVLKNDNFIHGIGALPNRNSHIFEENLESTGVGYNSLLLLGEYGPIIHQAMRFSFGNRWFKTVWITTESGTKGRFEPSELFLKIDDRAVKVPPKMAEEASKLAAQWEEQRRSGAHVASNNSTLSLSSLTSTAADEEAERSTLVAHFARSFYANNAVAKGPLGAVERWQELQKLEYPPEPAEHLASGVGVAICVFCDGGKKIVLGQRSLRETFRKGEFDIAVVEGIRPTANVSPDRLIDLYGVLYRALDEELGTDRCQQEFGRPLKDLILDAAIFEVGLDMKFYQWNFLAYVVTSLKFHEVEQLWHRAKDRKENQRLTSIPATRDDAARFLIEHNIWSCGCACMLHSLEIVSGKEFVAVANAR